MAKRLKIGVDVDEVLADFISAFKKEAENVLGRPMENVTRNWNFSDWMTKAECKRVWDHIEATEDWYYLYESPLPGVARNLPWLMANHVVFFMTSRKPTAGMPIEKQTQMWIADLNVEYPTVIVSSNKGPIAAGLELDVFVDDKVGNLADVERCSPNTRLFIQTQPQNELEPTPKNWTRVNSFESFVDAINV